MVDFNEEFKKNRLVYSSYLMVLGLIVVFIALLMTSVVIWQLGVINRKTSEAAPTSIISKVGRIITDKSESLQGNAIVAVVATIEKLKADTITESRIMMTFRRTQVNMWHASGKIEMTTIKFNALRMRRKS
jgi:Na+-transporting methylmalonyl-CoA/oxaloacetate decarboxylase gamma subunit